MGWLDRLRGVDSTEPLVAEAEYADVGVPDLAEPLHVRAVVLERNAESATVDAQPPGRDSFRAQLRSGTDPGGFSGLVPAWHVPAIIDASEPQRTFLLEPPCGPDLPLVSEEMQKIRDIRDLRTSALLRRYPPPAAADLAQMLEPTSSAAHPSFDAICYRIGLLTTTEARSILDRIRGDGNEWEQAEKTLYSYGPSLPEALRKSVGSYLAHLDAVAPHGRGIDKQPFWTFGVAAAMRDLFPKEVDAVVFERVMRPFVDVCGSLPPQLQ